MDGLLLVHAKSGHVLLSKAYTEGFGIKIEDQDSDSAAKKDPMVASMLLANFICAFYTNVINLVDESALSSSSSLQELMRDPLQSFDTGCTGPELFFRRDIDTNVLCCVFLKRAITHAPVTDDDAATESMRASGEWLAEQILSSFVRTYSAELSAKPMRATTKTFKPFLKVAEELYTSTFSRHILQSVLGHISHARRPNWIYVLFSSAFTESMDRTQSPSQSTATAAKSHSTAASLRSIKVADIGAMDVMPSGPRFIPRPPTTPAPATVATLLLDSHPGSSSASSSSVSSVAFAASASPVAPAVHPSSFGPSRPVSSRLLHPFRPPVRRWWQFGRGKESIPLFYSKLGRTTCMYHIPTSEEEEDGMRPASLFDRSSEKEPSHATRSMMPSPDALHKLVALVHNAGQLLAAPTEIADRMKSMEIQLRPSSTTSPASAASFPACKLWILRLRDLILCFPTDSDAHTAHSSPSPSPSPQQCTLPSLLASLSPFLDAIHAHYAFVDTIHERNYRALQKNLQKQNQNAK